MGDDDYTWEGPAVAEPVSPWQLRIDEDLATVDVRTCDQKFADVAMELTQIKEALEYLAKRQERLERTRG